jgi:hypothetical protein
MCLPNNTVFPKCNQQDDTLSNLFISIKCSTFFRRFLHPTSGAQTVHTASGICQTLLLTAAVVFGMELEVLPELYIPLAARFDQYQKLYVQFELLMMGGGKA